MFISECYNYALAFSDWLWLTHQQPPLSSKNLFEEPPLYGELDDGGLSDSFTILGLWVLGLQGFSLTSAIV